MTKGDTGPRVTYKHCGRLSNGASRLHCCSEYSAVDSVETKRTKLDGKVDDQNFVTRDYQANSRENESGHEKALRNPIILRNVFKYFSTSFLLSSCSLVNKTWNRDARIFVRHYRRCAARNPSKSNTTDFRLCQLLLDLGNLYRQMREQGRQAPFNGLRVKFRHVAQGCPQESGCDGAVHMNLPREMVLKYLDITCESDNDQHHIQPSIYSLTCSHASEIEHLQASSVLLLKDPISEQVPDFPKLKDITIARLRSYDETAQRDILRKIHSKSPCLQTIFVDDRTDAVDIVPREMYHLLGNLEICLEQGFEETFPFRDIVTKKPKLRGLTILEYFNDDAEVQHKFRNSAKQLLQCCEESVEHLVIHVDGFYVLPLFSQQALINLSKLDLVTSDERKLQELWDALVSIDSEKMMPKLEEVRIMFDMTGMEPLPEWPANKDYKVDVHQIHHSVRKLTLELSFFVCNMTEVRTVFPHVTSIDYAHLHPPGHVPCREFLELWPQLEELRVSGVYNMLGKNYDADFCGINEEEVELLREMDDQYLRTVRIVPIRPSLLAMLNLRRLTYDIQFDDGPEASISVGPPVFISRVTELVVLERSPHTKLCICCEFLSESECDDREDDDDESDGDDDGD